MPDTHSRTDMTGNGATVAAPTCPLAMAVSRAILMEQLMQGVADREGRRD